MNKTDIEWCDYTWNPITGCKRNCNYCYARRIHNRFNKGRPFSDIVFHPERLQDKMPKKPSKIFVGSMSDFEYWELSHFEKILEVCANNPHHTFMFLSKNPVSRSLIPWPDNTMQGITITHYGFDHEKAEQMETRFPRPFLSIEPILEPVTFLVPDFFEIVIVGAETGTSAEPVTPNIIESVERNVKPEQLFWKSNIQKYRKAGALHYSLQLMGKSSG